MKISELVDEARPRELAKLHGVSSLSDVHLLAILISGGIPGHNAIDIANDMLRKAGSLTSIFAYSRADLIAFPGIGNIKATQLLATFEFAKRVHQKKSSLPTSISKEELWRCFYKEEETQEEAIVLLLSPSRKPLGTRLIYRGNLKQTSFHQEDVLSSVLSSGAKRFILIHNHPSGKPNPSMEDIFVVGKMAMASYKVGVKMEDFVIVATEGVFSYKEDIAEWKKQHKEELAKEEEKSRNTQ